MNTKKIIKVLYIISIVLLFTACNEESYIENLGYVSEVESDTSNLERGRVIFYTTNGFNETCINGLKIYLQGEYVGKLIVSTQTMPVCGENSQSALTLTLPVGTYSYSANGEGTYCASYANSGFTIEKGVCIMVSLN